MTFRYKGSLNGTAPIYKKILVGDSQTLKQGYAVVLTSNKAVAAADSAAAGTVLGIINNDITTGVSAGDDDFGYVDENPSSIYNVPYDGSATPAIGAKYNFHSSGTPYTLDSDDTTTAVLQVIGYPNTTAKTVDVILCNRVFGNS